MVNEAQQRYPHLEFRVGDIEDPRFMSSMEGPFDYIVLSDVIGSLDDCEATLECLHALCTCNTRLVIAYHSNYWEWILRIAELISLKMPQREQNFFSNDDMVGLMNLADFEVIRRDWRQLVPRRLLFLGPLVNRGPALRRRTVVHGSTARKMEET